MKIYVHTLLSSELSNRIAEAFTKAHSITFRSEAGLPESAPEAFKSADAILGNPPLSWWKETAPDNLKFWQLDSAGFDQYRSVSTNAKVANMGDWFAWPCAESIVAGVMSLYRGLNKLALLQKEKKWVGAPLREQLYLLHRKKVVILGAGTIGLAVKSIVSGFDTQTTIVARSSPDADLHSKEELLKILPETDLVVNTLPGAAGQYVDGAFLDAMQKGSVYANVGRGSTTDEAYLIERLRDGHLGGAVLDVTETEPLPENSPLWDMENVILTQHTGGGQANEDLGKVILFIENFSNFISGEPIRYEVSISKGY